MHVTRAIFDQAIVGLMIISTVSADNWCLITTLSSVVSEGLAAITSFDVETVFYFTRLTAEENLVSEVLNYFPYEGTSAYFKES